MERRPEDRYDTSGRKKDKPRKRMYWLRMILWYLVGAAAGYLVSVLQH
jgi:hypothetical protein